MKDGTLIQKNSVGYYFVESTGCYKAEENSLLPNFYEQYHKRSNIYFEKCKVD